MEYKITKERSHLFSPTPNTQLVITFKGHPSVDDLRQAIAKTAQKHELLRASLSLRENGDAYYVVSDNPGYHFEELPALPELTAFVQQQACRPFDCEHGELIRFYAAAGDDGVRLAISAHHMVGDDASLLLLVRDITEHLANPRCDAQIMPIRQLAADSAAARQKLPFSVSTMMKLTNFQWKRQGKVFSFTDHAAMVSAHAEKNPGAVCEQLLTPEQTAQLLAWCKSVDVDLLTAVAGAFLYISEENSISILCSLRSENDTGMGTFATSVSVDYYPLPESGFVTRIREMQERIADKTGDPQKAQFQLGFLSSLSPTLVDSAYFAAFHNYANPVSQRAMMMFGLKSSPKALSIHDLTAYDDISVADLSFIPTLTPNVRRALALTMVNGQLRITMQYPVRESGEMMRVFNESILLLLRQGRPL